MAAAREFLRMAQAGQVTASEVKEAQSVINSPELADAFAQMAQEFTALTGGQGQPLRDVKALRPDTKRLTNAATLPERFLSDLTLVRSQLFDPSLSRSEKAERLFEFFEAYAGRFVELNAEAPMNEADLQKTLANFEKALDRAGFQNLTAGDGRTGTEAARDMLKAKNKDALRDARPQSLDAPGWKENAVAEQNAKHVEQKRIELQADRLVQLNQRLTPAQLAEEAKKKEEEKKRSKSRSGVLGGNQLWNVMHLLRGDGDLTEVQKRDALNQLIVAAALIFIFVGIVVGILVSM